MIEFKNVFKQYSDDIIASNDINIRIDQGEFVYVVGPSGAGKSTFIKMMYHEEQATSGEITVNNFQLQTMKPKEVPFLRRDLGIVFQDFKLLPRLTIFENIAYALEVIEKEPAEIKERVDYVLDLVDLADKSDKFPEELSGGEQQRIAIARAVANKPEVLIADEPTGNLDPETSDDIMAILEKVNKQGTTVIMATHNSIIVNKYPHRLLAIEDGRIARDEEGGKYGYENENV
ncbi:MULTISPECIES: cell division ATP-binding protein FtsE [Dellaglioa]|uniref:Cell division ATP-binding protein FtsE n=3 Tax=Dellaglioa TaxID=2767880 RepID=A0A0R1HI76_9LACO|nr:MULTISPECIES: cell division ATP-binding protein FtsE [Dellaglioa]KRK45768.1 cell division ATP-binding protein FtsE [Dellaglioa algida DSM 15638]MCZ2491719.1 cell division ATP-binding protein FtsE [Dellaglioa carnosa]MCZ2493228.1 cell division ATP-binding protein FtsE [Dellaglioa carnosa]MCZ2494881.1 cell division ATP-binding protein FtsE [Dellaglioa carnosa]MDK1717145.1 cell division ATP-binding protein FtsE [Dellaglioa algida]